MAAVTHCCLCSLLFVLSAIVRDRECCTAGQQSELSPSVDQQEGGGGGGEEIFCNLCETFERETIHRKFNGR